MRFLSDVYRSPASSVPSPTAPTLKIMWRLRRYATLAGSCLGLLMRAVVVSTCTAI